MHELSIIRGVIETAQAAARDAGAKRVTAVRLRVGELANVDPAALQFAFAAVVARTLLNGARLDVVPVPVAVRCPECSREGELMNLQRFACPHCGTPTADVVRGRELEVESIEVV